MVLIEPTVIQKAGAAFRADLLSVLRRKGLRRLDAPIALAHGAQSSDFVDIKKALASGRDLRMACEVISISALEIGCNFDAVGGLTLGADPLAAGIALLEDVRWFVVRQKRKERGTRRRIEGARIGAGDRVLLVDDVVTSGGSMLQAYKVVKETGAEVVAATALVDRAGIAKRHFEALGVRFFPIFTYEDMGISPVSA